MLKYAFIIVTDYYFFPGTLATVSSILEFHPDADVLIVENSKLPLSEPQASCLMMQPRIQLIPSSELEGGKRFIGAWELKAYAASDLGGNYDVIIGIDSDCLLCSPISEEIERCHEHGLFLGGKDGKGVNYDETYAVYGIMPKYNPKYMSTSCYLVAINEVNQGTLKKWAECCSQAVFNGQGPYVGHGDQGVLNAILFAEDEAARVELLDNELWSQHWRYWDSIIDYSSGHFLNLSSERRYQRTFHCGGSDKYWAKSHRDMVLEDHPLQTYPYVWFLAMFWFGRCRIWTIDPFQYIPPESHHLTVDLVLFLPQIIAVYPNAKSIWSELSDQMIDRLLSGIPRMLSLGGGSMTELIDLIAAYPHIRRYVEIGSYLGGSVMALALRFANRDIDFFAVESFMGNMDGTMDGHMLPSRKQFLETLARFPSLRVKLVACSSLLAADTFEARSIDLLFVDGCHETSAVLRDIDTWLPKISDHGIIAGDDYGWSSVKAAVEMRFTDVNVSSSGCVWWKEIG